MSDLYTSDGWLNFDYIADRGKWLNVIIGARQVGKTYGCLKYMLDNNLYHMLLRRTTAELELIAADNSLNPYLKFDGIYQTSLFRKHEGLCRICDYETDENGKMKPTLQRGLALSLPEIAHIKGFSGDKFTELVFDEAVPEKGVITRSSEGESFLNGYTTINANREIDKINPRPPVRVWLLSNSNRIDSPVFEALNVIDMILYARRKDLEELYDDGVAVIQPKSEVIINQRKETALMKLISKKSAFYGMAIENEFSYDKSPYITTLSIKGMQPLFKIGMFTCWQNGDGFYICRAPFTGKTQSVFEDDNNGREQVRTMYAILKAYYYAGLVKFSDLYAITIFKRIFNIA